MRSPPSAATASLRSMPATDPGELLAVSLGPMPTAWWWPTATRGGTRYMGPGPEEVKLPFAPIAVAVDGDVSTVVVVVAAHISVPVAVHVGVAVVW